MNQDPAHCPAAPPARARTTPAERLLARALCAASSDFTALVAQGTAIDSAILQRTMQAHFAPSPHARAPAPIPWSWHHATDAVETAIAATVVRYADAFAQHSVAQRCAMLETLATLEPSHRVRSLEQQRLQQFSTPWPLAGALVHACALRPDDTVLEPSAGTGVLAALLRVHLTFAHTLHLNEISATRRALLEHLLPAANLTAHDAQHLNALLPSLAPSVVCMNPPFSRSATLETRQRHAALHHIAAAFSMLRPGGRLVALTGHGCDPHAPEWRARFNPDDPLHPAPVALASWRICPKLYRSRGVQFPIRLTVLERPLPDRDPAPRAPHAHPDEITSITELVARIDDTLPPRPLALAPTRLRPRPRTAPRAKARAAQRAPALREPVTWPDVRALAYNRAPTDDPHAAADAACIGYVPWRPRTISIDNARPHPTELVESTPMYSVRHPAPTYQPQLPLSLVTDGVLSDAQLETVVLAGAAHQRRIATPVLPDTPFEDVAVFERDPPDPEHPDAVFPRRGFFLGDGTGTGKGRQVAAMILDQWLRGHRRALWVSQSDHLIADAIRDWTALGGSEHHFVRVRDHHANDVLNYNESILFTTYATLRSPSSAQRRSRLSQIVAWLGRDRREQFEGLIVFDESHALANAAPTAGEHGTTEPSRQGLAAMRLQYALPNARIVYVSATGASSLQGLAYTTRLGLWDSDDTEFLTREDFVDAVARGGIAALEVIARDLKALGLYQSRSLAYHGIETDLLTHRLTPDQVEIYDAYADAFAIIHTHLDAALKETNIVGSDGTNDPRALAAAKSAFESMKQRFFGHLLCGMKCKTLIPALEEDLRQDLAPVIQIVSTGEALMRRRLEQIPPHEWEDLHLDPTPRDSVSEYITRCFPTQLRETYTDPDGGEQTRFVTTDDGTPVHDPVALERREALLLHIGSLPPVPTALDQLLHHFGHDAIAEITGRSQRILRLDDRGHPRLALRPRPATASKVEADDFMAGDRAILIFSQAGGTGRSYHASLDARNQKRRVHYLVEAGWRADVAVQGLGRTHRTHQASAPRFRPVTTNVRAEARFISTIVRRLDALGAITRGERNAQTRVDANTTLYRPEDNLEGPYALTALNYFYSDLRRDRIPHWNTKRFQQATGLSLDTKDGQQRFEHPKMSTTLNRLLALRIADQNELFAALMERLDGVIADAKDAGLYDQGMEQLTANSITIASRATLHTHPATEGLTELLTLDLVHERVPFPDADLDALLKHPHSLRVVNSRSKRAALCTPHFALRDEKGNETPRVRLYHPFTAESMNVDQYQDSHWKQARPTPWRALWDDEIANASPTFQDTVHLVTGLLLPVWRTLSTSTMRVRRVLTDEGETFLGFLATPLEAHQLTAQSNAGPIHTSASELYKMVLAREATLRLQSQWTLSQRRVHNVNRIEIHTPTHRDNATLKHLGVQIELINYTPRYTVPNVTVLERLLKRWPLTDLLPHSTQH